MNPKKRKFMLILDEQQYQDIITAVETFHRVICGQVEELKLTGGFKISRETLAALKREMFPELAINASYSWCGGHKDKELDRLQAATYAIYREMRHKRAVDDGCDDYNIYTGETLTCRKCRLPEIQIVKG